MKKLGYVTCPYCGESLSYIVRYPRKTWGALQKSTALQYHKIQVGHKDENKR